MNVHPNKFDEHKFKSENVHAKMKFEQACPCGIIWPKLKISEMSDLFVT